MKKLMSGLAIAAIASTAFVGAVSAQRNADSGNGGVSSSDSSGGAVTVGSANTGSAVGSTSVVNAGELVAGEDVAAAAIAAILAQMGLTETE